MKKIFMIIIFIFLLSGCKSYTELNNLGVINTIGIEKNNNQYKLYASIISDLENNKNEIYEVSGLNIIE